MNAISLTYSDVEKLLQSLCWRFCRRTGAPFDVAMSEANAAYVAAYNSYQPGRGSTFATWVRRRVDYALREFARQHANDRLAKTRRFGPSEDTADRERFDLTRFAEELSNDARTVIRLAIEPPTDVMLSAHTSYGPCPSGLKKGILEFLADIGWTAQRIGESFREIGEALCD